jgi:hypothetical protein
MPVPNKPYDFIDGTDIVADEVNENFDRLYDTLDGAIDEDNIADGGVTPGKLSASVAGQATRLASSGITLGTICSVTITATGKPILCTMNSSGTSSGTSTLDLYKDGTLVARLGIISSTHQHDAGSWLVIGQPAGSVTFDIRIGGGSLGADTTLSVVEQR